MYKYLLSKKRNGDKRDTVEERKMTDNLYGNDPFANHKS